MRSGVAAEMPDSVRVARAWPASMRAIASLGMRLAASATRRAPPRWKALRLAGSPPPRSLANSPAMTRRLSPVCSGVAAKGCVPGGLREPLPCLQADPLRHRPQIFGGHGAHDGSWIWHMRISRDSHSQAEALRRSRSRANPADRSRKVAICRPAGVRHQSELQRLFAPPALRAGRDPSPSIRATKTRGFPVPHRSRCARPR